MFRPVTMRQVSAVVLERDERAILRELGRLGVVQLTRTCAGPDTAPLSPHNRTNDLARCDHLLVRVAELRQACELSALAGDVKPPDISLAEAEERLRSMSEATNELLERRARLTRRSSELAAVCEKVSDYRGLDIPLEQPDQFSFLHFVTGSLPPDNLELLEQTIGANVALLPLPAQKARQPLIAMTTRKGRPALDNALRQASFQPESLPTIENATVDTVSEQGQREQNELSAELDQLNAELRRLATTFAHPLAEIEIAARTERRLLEAEQNFPRTEAAILVNGWVPADDAATLEERL